MLARAAGPLVFLTAVATTAVSGAMAAPAAAHSLGPPQTLHLSAAGSQVSIRWQAAIDDLVALGLETGVLGEARTFIYDDGKLVTEESDPGDVALLAGAPELRDYLLDHIVVRQGKAVCPGEVATTEQLGTDGVRLRYECAEQVGTVTVEASTLTDVHPAYRTLASTNRGQRAVYTQETVRHEWVLAGGSDPDNRRLVTAVALAGAGAVAALAAGYLISWRRRPGRTPDTAASEVSR